MHRGRRSRVGDVAERVRGAGTGRSCSTAGALVASLAPADVVALTFADGLVSDSGVGVPVGQRTFAVQTFRPNLVMGECSSLLFEP